MGKSYKWDTLLDRYWEWQNDSNEDNARALYETIEESSDGLLDNASSYLNFDLKGWKDQHGIRTPPQTIIDVSDSSGPIKDPPKKKALEEKIKDQITKRKTKPGLKWIDKKIKKGSTKSEKDAWKAIKKIRIKEEIKKTIKIKERFRYHLRERAIGDRHKVPYNPRKIGGRSGAYKRPIWHLKAVKKEAKALEKKYIASFRDKEVGKWSAKKIKSKKRKP